MAFYACKFVVLLVSYHAKSHYYMSLMLYINMFAEMLQHYKTRRMQHDCTISYIVGW